MQALIGNEFPKELIPLIKSAKHTIRVIVFIWKWYETQPGNSCQLFTQSIIAAGKRGVDVRACVNSRTISSFLSQNGIKCRIPISKSLMHTKMILIDDNICVLGSHNFSQSAFSSNFETSVLLKDDPSIERFSQFFESMWSLN